MISKKQSYLIGLIFVLALSCVALVFFALRQPGDRPAASFNKGQANSGNTPGSTSTTEVYTNKKGQRWTLDDKADFSISSGADAKISFLQGHIEPLKVHPGDTQRMKVVVRGVNGISKVVAEIETDNGIQKVELTKTGIMAAKDLDLNLARYRIDQDNHLQIRSEQEAIAYRNQEIKAEETNASSVSLALAASGDKEIWEGSWLVKDTSVKSYNTTFIATDSQGKQEKLVLAWSDPCTLTGDSDYWPASGTITVAKSCSIAQPYGIDGGNITLAPGANIYVRPGGMLVFNPGNSIIIPFDIKNRGSITIDNSGAGASMSKGYIWVQDYDGDGFPASDMRYVGASATTPPASPAGLRRQKDISTTTLDCYDNNGNAKPGQTAYFGTNRGDGSFDYDCDGTVTRDPSEAIDDEFGVHPNNKGYESVCTPVMGGYCDGYEYQVWWGYASSNCGETVYYQNVCSTEYGCQGKNDYVRNYNQPPLRCR